jgi:hypothetical protein
MSIHQALIGCQAVEQGIDGDSATVWVACVIAGSAEGQRGQRDDGGGVTSGWECGVLGWIVGRGRSGWAGKVCGDGRKVVGLCEMGMGLWSVETGSDDGCGDGAG